MQKTKLAIHAYDSGDRRAALRIAKDFRIKVSHEEAEAMKLAYECIVYPEFYKSIGKDVDKIKSQGMDVLQAVIRRMRTPIVI